VCTILLLPLSEQLVRDEVQEEEMFRTREVETVTLSPPESSQKQTLEKDENPEQTAAGQDKTF
ncbi:MAG: hypothetical protein R6U40_13105, partial [Desulfobacterales bacterium]